MRAKRRFSRMGGWLVAAALGVGLAGAGLAAEEAGGGRNGPPPEVLAASEGEFDLTFTPAQGSTGTSTCRVGLGGLWWLEHVRADLGGRPYEGRGATSYDPATGRFVNVWIDSMSPRPLVTTGTYDPASKSLRLVGEMAGPDGATSRVTLVTTLVDASTRTFSMSGTGPDGKPSEMFRLTYRRRGK